MKRQILIAYTEKKYFERKLKNYIFCALLILSAFVALTPLFSVFAYVVKQGWAGINLSFFTEIPKPVGEAGGGMANALAGTAILISLASAVGIPWGIAIGVYLSEYGRGHFANAVRFATDTL